MKGYVRWTPELFCVLVFFAGSCTESDGSSTTRAMDAGVDAADLDATDLDATDLDATDLDGIDLDGIDLDATPDSTIAHDVIDDVVRDAVDVTPGDGGGEDTSASLRTLSDYRRCRRQADCPVGLGTCVTRVALNRVSQNGRSTVAISDIFGSVEEGQGICTFVCTDDVAACDDLSVNGVDADPAPHACQLVYVDTAPYPKTAPAFPFDDQLDPAQQALGAAFGAVCRPPFGLDDTVDDSLCSACDSDQDCSDQGATCWNFRTGAPADSTSDQPGDATACLPTCTDNDDCPSGFACDAVDDPDERYCRPIEGTCSICRDHDGDGIGDGRCADDQTPTAHDCDDTNPRAYFDPDDPEHAFPSTCGQQDFNCNGVSDATEEIGADAFSAEHCTACFHTCAGALPNAQKSCAPNPDDQASNPWACTAECDVDAQGNPTHADCNGDPSDGCEIAVNVDPQDNPEYFVYPDKDGDGFGDAVGAPVFVCDGTTGPAGYVANDLDCDDGVDPNSTDAATINAGAAAIHPGATEMCDGVDNDCDQNIDEDDAADAIALYADADADRYGDPTDSVVACSRQGYVADDSDCDDANPDIHPGAAEVCNFEDDDCDSQTDEQLPINYYPDFDEDGFGASFQLFAPDLCGPPPPSSPYSGVAYVDNADDCDNDDPDTNPDATEVCNLHDDDCDGEINEGLNSTFFYDADGDTFGDPTRSSQRCSPGPSWVTTNSDCDDSDAYAYPGAAESEPLSACMRDADQDGYGDSSPGAGVSAGDDCDDSRDDTHAGALEVCDVDPSGNDIDNDCDQTANEGCPVGIDISNAEFTSTRAPATIPGGTKVVDEWTCDDGYVLGNVKVRYFETPYLAITAVRGFCEPLHLSDEDGDSLPDQISVDDTSALSDYWSRWVGIPEDYIELTQQVANISCTDTPAQVMTDFTVDTRYGQVKELRLHCSSLDLDLPSETTMNPAQYSLGAGTTGVVGLNQPGSRQSGTCGAGSVAMGFHLTYGFNEPQSQVGIRQFAFECRPVTLDLK